MFDGKAFGVEIVGVVKSYLENQLSPVLARVEALEKRLAEMPTPKDGEDADPRLVASMVAGEIKADLAKMQTALDAIQPAPELPNIAGMIEEAVAAIPAPLSEDGIKGIVDGAIAALPPAPELPDVAGMIKLAVDAIPAPISEDKIKGMIDGAISVLPPAPEMPDVSGMIEMAVAAIPDPISPDGMKVLIAEVIEAQPAPEPMEINYTPSPEQIREWAAMVAEIIELPKDVTVDDVSPMIEEQIAKGLAAIPVPKDGKDGKDGAPGKDGEPGKDGAPGKDGVGLAGGIIDRDGHLNFTLTDGTVRDLGMVCGKDGEPGKPGADGFGFDDLTEELADDGRTIITRYIKGERVKEFRHALAVVLDRGVYKSGCAYQTGDGVSYGGSFWIAQATTDEKPEGGKGWRLAVKRGRDGKDGVMKAERPNVPIRVGVPSKEGD